MKEFHFKINGTGYKAHVAEQADGQLIVTVNGRAYQVELPGKKPVVVQPVRPAVIAKAPVAAAAAPRGTRPVHDSQVTSPLPGTISKVMVKDGQEVKKGEVLLVMEAMKMANDIVAEAEGVVKKVLVGPGQTVNQGEPLVDFQGYTAAPLAAASNAAPAPIQKSGVSLVEAPLPGTVKQILVKPGQQVNAGDTVVTLEAMKMENSITAEFGGTVKAVLVSVDAQVNQGDVLVEIG